MTLVLVVLFLSATAHAASPLEADFADGYWDRDIAAYGGRMASVYSMVLAVDDPVKVRAAVETASVQTPYQVVTRKDVMERIEWIENEKARSAEALKSMPVSRAMIESKLKRLKATLDALKASEGIETVSVQIVREDSDAAKPPPAKP